MNMALITKQLLSPKLEKFWQTSECAQMQASRTQFTEGALKKYNNPGNGHRNTGE